VLVYAGVSSTRPDERDSTPAATLNGCLRNGSAPSVFLLRGAQTADGQGGARDYLLVSVPGNVNLQGALNHQVSIDGDAFAASEGPEPPAAANTVEKALRRLAVRAMRDSGNGCA
jgi:hypothetical protein